MKTSNEVGFVELRKDGKGAGDCRALITCWHRGVQQEGQGELQKQSVMELENEKRLLLKGYKAGDVYTCIGSTILHDHIEF